MNKFEFPEYTAVKKVHVNVREELHGTEKVTAMDLQFEITALNELLDLLHPDLRAALYFNADADAGQEPVEGVKTILPNLRFPHLNGCAFKWATKEKLQGYRLFVDYGIDEQAPIFLELCKVTGRSFEIMEGGSVKLKWTVQASGDQLTTEVRGILTGSFEGEIKIKLLAPVAGDEKPAGAAPMENPFADIPGATDPDKPLTVEDIFMAGHAPGDEPGAAD